MSVFSNAPKSHTYNVQMIYTNNFVEYPNEFGELKTIYKLFMQFKATKPTHQNGTKFPFNV